MTKTTFQSIPPVEAQRLVAEGRVRPIDVRTPAEFRDLGHIPGALLLPVDLVAVAPATLPREGLPLLVYCEHGVRSAAAARFLTAAGFPGVLNMSGGMSAWTGPRDSSPGDPFGPAGPSSWLVENADLLPAQGGRVLDVACGRGRHALLLAAAGFHVKAVDRDAASIEALNEDARRLGLEIQAEPLDLEAGDTGLGEGLYDLVIVIHYLHRPLLPSLARTLRPGGILLYETFTRDQAQRGHPRNPDFLLDPGELPRLVAPLEILRQREGEFEGRCVAGVAARRNVVGPG
ncbi:MAG: rhodanese-like domain-containing protein [Candidatus Polarisedimenticolia bacterium]